MTRETTEEGRELADKLIDVLIGLGVLAMALVAGTMIFLFLSVAILAVQ